MRVHYCHIPGCSKVIKPAMLFCAAHWAMVPKEMQDRVYETYRNGKCEDRHPTRDWIKAASEARRYVEKKINGK